MQQQSQSSQASGQVSLSPRVIGSVCHWTLVTPWKPERIVTDARIFPLSVKGTFDRETDRRARITETRLPEAKQESGLQACCRTIEIKRKSSNPFKQQQAVFRFTTAKCLAFSLSNLQCSRVSRWLVGTKMLQVTQNRSGILLTDACGICLANLLLLWWTRLLLNVCCLLHVYYDGEVYIGVCRTVSTFVMVGVLSMFVLAYFHHDGNVCF